MEASAEFPRYNPTTLMIFGAALVVIGVACYWYTREDYSFTGYIRAWALVWVSGLILVMQSVLIRRSNLFVGLIFGVLALVPPVDRFFIYGQRGDTFRLAIIVIPVFLFFGRRPPRAVFIPAAICLVLVLSVLERTRGTVENGQASNRVQALVNVLPDFFKERSTSYYGTEDFIYGSAMVDAVRNSGEYNYGRCVVDFAVRFLPKELFDKDKYYSQWSRPLAAETTSLAAGYSIDYGSFASGYAFAFVEFWWFTVFFWAGLGYWIRRQYVAASNTSRLDQHAYFVTLFIMLLYLITQDINDFLLNIVCLNIPLLVAYRYSREHAAPNEESAPRKVISEAADYPVELGGAPVP